MSSQPGREPPLRARRAERLAGQLRELRDAYERALAAPRVHSRPSGEPHVLFEVAGTSFALPADELGEVRAARDMVRVPAGDSALAGAIAHHQEIVQVIDLCALFELSERREARPGWILVLRPLARRTAVYCDRLLGLQRVDAGECVRVDHPHAAGHFVCGARSVAILRCDALVRAPERAGVRP